MTARAEAGRAETDRVEASREERGRPELPGFAGKVALLIGSSRGLGRAVAGLLAEQGAHVVLNSANTAVDGRLVAKRIKAEGGRATYVRADVADEAQVAELAALVRERFGRLDILVHCAAGGTEARVIDADAEMFQRSLAVNSYSLVSLVRHLSPLMPRGGKVLYMTSVGAVRSSEGYGVVGAAKAASESLVRSLALELAPRGVSVNAVRATVFPTLSLSYFSQAEAWLAMCESETPMGPPPVEKIAETVLLLCAAGADYVTGQVVNVDGGWFSTVHRPAFSAREPDGEGHAQQHVQQNGEQRAEQEAEQHAERADQEHVSRGSTS
ncbi:SDR family oxidoreductase [Streptomyces sp. ODS28]|uniref:SDR family NAD(P)-dependent oxidoreductase n=1 Tax=Streptomyces sp. ODS28 TaxID=3136688 RepID=UPI0031EF5A24